MRLALETNVRGWEIPRTEMHVYGVAHVKGKILGESFSRQSADKATLYDPSWKNLYTVVASDRTQTLMPI